jgi:hypothetical protein
MAGYIIYSLDWPRFRDMVERPGKEQLVVLAHLLSDELEAMDEDIAASDPLLQGASDPGSLGDLVARRLALPDWYGDLSRGGKCLWQFVIFRACMNCDDLDLGFRVDSDGVYWDVIEIAWKHLGVPPNRINEVALSAFGTRPFRYHKQGAVYDDWLMHSMHTPDEVQQMRAELRSVAPAIAAADDDVREEYTTELMPAIESIADEGRMLFIQVDT